MAKSLVIVESPAKAKTINKYLGSEYTVLASMGHVRDLPKSKLGVDVDEGFAPVYEPLASRKKVIAELKSAAKDAGCEVEIRPLPGVGHYVDLEAPEKLAQEVTRLL